MSGSDVTYQFFLQRVAQLAAHRAARRPEPPAALRARRLLLGASADFRFVALQLKSLFPELTSLEARASRPTKCPSRCRPPRRRRACACSSSATSSSWPARASRRRRSTTARRPLPRAAFAAHALNCEAAFLALEVWWTHRACESLSSKERAGGATYQPPPVLNLDAAAALSATGAALLFANVDVDGNLRELGRAEPRKGAPRPGRLRASWQAARPGAPATGGVTAHRPILVPRGCRGPGGRLRPPPPPLSGALRTRTELKRDGGRRSIASSGRSRRRPKTGRSRRRARCGCRR